MVIAQKHIFTSHYFFARVEYIALFPDDPSAEQPGTYVVYVDRSLFDDSLGSFKRALHGARRAQGRERAPRRRCRRSSRGPK